MNTYTTSEIAKIIGIHPNTVRLYEECGLIPKPKRRKNGYREFTDFHIEQFKIARTALKEEVLQNGLRKKAINIIKISANGDFDDAIYLAKDYLKQIKKEQVNAEEAIEIVRDMLSGNESNHIVDSLYLRRKEAADYLQITIDTLRNWEMNGLLNIKRKQNGYRIYTEEDIMRLKVIRSLRCANYSLSSILRMLEALSINPNVNIRKIIDTPREDDDIVSVCDKLLTSLKNAELNAQELITQLKKMKKQFNLYPPL